jgi:hypothetical protein
MGRKLELLLQRCESDFIADQSRVRKRFGRGNGNVIGARS